jgi:hypothetical protein
MECFSHHSLELTKNAYRDCGDEGEGFISQVETRPDCRLVTVTRENRDALVTKLLTPCKESSPGSDYVAHVVPREGVYRRA